MARAGLLWLPLLCLGLFGWLVAVGARSWRRMSALRMGRPPPAPAPVQTRSSSTTRIAAATGATTGMWGVAVVAAGRPAGAVLAIWGGAVAISGVRSRVTGLSADREGFVVRYAARRPVVFPWGDWLVLRPPRWPLGGWVLVGRTARRTLMPSDVLGQEQALESIVAFAGLRHDGRAWVRAP